MINYHLLFLIFVLVKIFKLIKSLNNKNISIIFNLNIKKIFFAFIILYFFN